MMKIEVASQLVERLNPMIERISKQRYLVAISSGLSMLVPSLIIASLFLMMAHLPLPTTWHIAIWLAQYERVWELPYQLSMGWIGFYLCFHVARTLAKEYQLEEGASAMLSILTLGLMISPYVEDQQWSSILGGSSIIVSCVAAIVSVELFRLLTKIPFVKGMEKILPSAMANNFNAILPSLLLLIGWFVVIYVMKVDVVHICAVMVTPLLWYVNSLFGILTVIILTCLFWSVGVHGVNVISMIFRPFWVMLVSINMASVTMNGTEMTIGNELFFQWFVWLGGSGTTIGLAILFRFFSKSKKGKALGGTSFSSAICNVNEPLIFGVPIMMNPLMVIPFFLTPIVCAMITWTCMKLGWISIQYATMPWTMPAPLGAFLSTGCDIRALILCGGLTLISILLYYPFFKKYEQQMLEEECLEEPQ